MLSSLKKRNPEHATKDESRTCDKGDNSIESVEETQQHIEDCPFTKTVADAVAEAKVAKDATKKKRSGRNKSKKVSLADDVSAEETDIKPPKKTKPPKICDHGRVKSTCTDCSRAASMCKHGRKKCRCKDCGGSSLCEHGRQKHLCRDCGGSSICEHDRRRSKCKECGGASLCEHMRIRSRCRDCGGVSICEHGRRRSTCKICGGSSVCEHGRIKFKCKDCGGSSICEHGRIRSRCKDCGASRICKHGEKISECKECMTTAQSVAKPKSAAASVTSAKRKRDSKDTQGSGLMRTESIALGIEKNLRQAAKGLKGLKSLKNADDEENDSNDDMMEQRKENDAESDDYDSDAIYRERFNRQKGECSDEQSDDEDSADY